MPGAQRAAEQQKAITQENAQASSEVETQHQQHQ